MYVCVCNAITDREVRAAVAAGANTLEDLQFELGVATCCGGCADHASQYLPEGSKCIPNPCETGSAALHVEPLIETRVIRRSTRTLPVHVIDKKAA